MRLLEILFILIVAGFLVARMFAEYSGDIFSRSR